MEVAAVAAVGGSGAGQASKPNNASAILSSVFLRRVTGAARTTNLPTTGVESDLESHDSNGISLPK